MTLLCIQNFCLAAMAICHILAPILMHTKLNAPESAMPPLIAFFQTYGLEGQCTQWIDWLSILWQLVSMSPWRTVMDKLWVTKVTTGIKSLEGCLCICLKLRTCRTIVYNLPEVMDSPRSWVYSSRRRKYMQHSCNCINKVQAHSIKINRPP